MLAGKGRDSEVRSLAGPAVREPVMPPALMLLAPFAVLKACRAVVLHRPTRPQFCIESEP